jgi:hypothetical protein
MASRKKRCNIITSGRTINGELLTEHELNMMRSQTTERDSVLNVPTEHSEQNHPVHLDRTP